MTITQVIREYGGLRYLLLDGIAFIGFCAASCAVVTVIHILING